MIQQSVAQLTLQPGNTVCAYEVQVKGTLYKNNMCVVLEKNDEGLVFGKIKLIIIHNNALVYFVTLKYPSVCLVDQGVHLLSNTEHATDQYFCIEHRDLLDYYPLPEYSMLGFSVIAMHHSVEKRMKQGVESRDDLKFVKEEDMVELIWPIQCRELLDCWKSQGEA